MRVARSVIPAFVVLLAVGALAAGPAVAGAGPSPYPDQGPPDAVAAQPRVVSAAPDADLVVDDTGNGDLVRVPSDGGATSVVASGLTQSYGVARDAAGNLYASDMAAGTVTEFPAAGGAPVTLASDLSQPNGVAVDRSGNVYVGLFGDPLVAEIPAGGGDPIPLLPAPADDSQVGGVAVDAVGDVFAATTVDGSIVEIPADGGAPVTVASDLGFTTGVTVADDGSLYATDFAGGTVYHVSADGQTTTVVGTEGEFAFPHGTSLDDDGNLYVVEQGLGDVVEVPADGGDPTVVASGFSGPLGVVAIRTHFPVVDPTITAEVTSPTPKTKFGWYRGPVTVHYTCVRGSAPLTHGCPDRVRLNRNVTDFSVGRPITATDGGTAKVVVKHINIDHTPPIPHLVRENGKVVCHATDPRSGVASCTVTKGHKVGRVVYTATAVDEAGNRHSITRQVEAG